MPQTRKKISEGGQRKKMTGAIVENGTTLSVIPAKNVTVKTDVDSVKGIAMKAVSVRSKSTGRLISSMNLDEMLEASRIAEMGLRGEKIPVAKSPKVQQYVGRVLRLDQRHFTKSVAKKMQQNLTVQIVERNKKTTNAIQAKRLYHALMNEK